MLTCPACGFENMQGSQVCARCRARLVWDGHADKADFRPPRAGRNKAGRSLLFFMRAKAGLKAPPNRPRREHQEKPANDDHRPQLSNVLLNIVKLPLRGWNCLPPEHKAAAGLSVIPGLGHFLLEENHRAAGFFCVWMVIWIILLLLYMFDGGSFVRLAAPLWFCAAIIHIYAAVSAARPSYCDTSMEARAVTLSIVVLGSAVYLVAAYLIQSGLTVTVFEYHRTYVN